VTPKAWMSGSFALLFLWEKRD